jgi:intraflagellar transport protein 81
MNPAELQKEIT